MPSLIIEISQTQIFNEYEPEQDECLKTLGTTECRKQAEGQDRLGNKDSRQMSQLYIETKKDKMQNMRWEIAFL